jgi:putative drug exporter of the RND superfamily
METTRPGAKTWGSTMYRHRHKVLLAWLVVLAAVFMFVGDVFERLDTGYGDDTSESAQVAERLRELDGTAGGIVAIVDGVDLVAPDVRAEIAAAADDLRAMDGVASVLDAVSTGAPQLVSQDQRATLVVAQLSADLTEDATAEATAAITERLRDIDAPQVKVGGSALLEEEFQRATEQDLQRGEMIALPIAFVVMIVIFGGLLAATLPLIIAVLGALSAILVLLAVAYLTDVSMYTINVVTMLGLGLGIDYGLLMVSRFREERSGGQVVPGAVVRTVATSGRTVVFSALTVAASLAGMFAFRDPTLRSLAIGGIGVVVLSMVVAVTLLPALLGMWGHRIKPAKARVAERGYFYRVSGFVQRRAVAVVTVVGIGLVILAAPFLRVEFTGGDARDLPRSSETREVALLTAERFPALSAEPITVLLERDASDPAVAAFVQRISEIDGVAGLMPRAGLLADVTVVDVYPEGETEGPIAQQLVTSIRAMDPPTEVGVTGAAAFLGDYKAAITERLPIALGLIAVATFVLLFLMTGSVFVPLKAIVMNLLSLGASFGALVWVFQDGHLSWLLGFDSTGAVNTITPILILIFAFGLSMDYEVFLLARVKEIHDQTGDNDLAVSLGLQRTGRIITSAALLIVVVFAGFAAGEVLVIKQLGLGLALAVVVDATIVRSLLVPATMKLMGDWNWWAPRPLRAIHARLGLHEPVNEPSLEPAAT